MKQQSKIGELLRKNGVKFTHRNQRQKIIPLFIEDETRKYERKQIIKSHDYFNKQINHNYTEMYMSTLFGMLFMNEKQYYTKRNKLLKLNNTNNKTINSLKKQNDNIKKMIAALGPSGSGNSHSLIICCCCLVTNSCLTICDPIDCSQPGSSVHGIFPGKNTGVGYHFLLQRIFPTQGWNPCLLHGQADSFTIEPAGKSLSKYIII